MHLLSIDISCGSFSSFSLPKDAISPPVDVKVMPGVETTDKLCTTFWPGQIEHITVLHEDLQKPFKQFSDNIAPTLQHFYYCDDLRGKHNVKQE